MTYSICITTVDRPYRQHLFRRLVETGTLTHSCVRGFHLAYDRLPNENTDHVFRQALMDRTDWILFLEDDIEIIDDFIGSTDRWLQRYATPEQHFYPLGCGVRQAMLKALRMGEHMWEWPLKEFFGATALVMRPAFVQGFCDLYRQQPRPAWWTEPTGLDENLKLYHKMVALNQYHLRTPVPCFVDHRGTQTAQTMAKTHWTGDYAAWQGTHVQYPK